MGIDHARNYRASTGVDDAGVGATEYGGLSLRAHEGNAPIAHRERFHQRTGVVGRVDASVGDDQVSRRLGGSGLRQETEWRREYSSAKESAESDH